MPLPYLYLRPHERGVLLDAVIAPRASRTAVIGLHGKRLKIALQAPPVEGKANAALISFLSKTLGVPQRNIEIVRGENAKAKSILLLGLTAELVAAKLNGETA